MTSNGGATSCCVSTATVCTPSASGLIGSDAERPEPSGQVRTSCSTAAPFLREAKAQGDILVVGLNSDQSVRDLKGPTRPITCQSERALVLAALSSVDYVTVFDEQTPLSLIELVKPDVLVKGSDYRKEEVVGAREVESWGGRVHLAGLRPGCSTTGTILRMVGQSGEEENLKKVA